MSHLDELKEQLGEAVAAQDFDTAVRLRAEIDSIQHSAKVRGVEEPAQAAYFQRREEESLKPSGSAR
ncbi:UvrB/UvrC motif-containing protein [Caulobacter segnis]|uniref:UvrB/UvrC motif-containing protein n=1 Tax=Caulobacter segnis TaxID=88688 RepID=UPI001CBB418D|nr:UvrB/UvrC motif-containing protein [Caulobacter segnis]UAL12061.1 UvrB/UvrC motif-containing protein [Caulobacter segnis]